MKIGISEDALRFETVKPTEDETEEYVTKVCDLVADSPNEFLVLEKEDGGFIAVLARDIRRIETDHADSRAVA